MSVGGLHNSKTTSNLCQCVWILLIVSSFYWSCESANNSLSHNIKNGVQFLGFRPQHQEDQQSQRDAWELHHLNGRGWWFGDGFLKNELTELENVWWNTEEMKVCEAQGLVETTGCAFKSLGLMCSLTYFMRKQCLDVYHCLAMNDTTNIFFHKYKLT